jgi:phosphatidylinositol phospholipase C delta
VQDLQTRPDLEMLYNGLVSEGPLDQSSINGFLVKTQGIQPYGIFEKYAQNGIWTLDSLTRFLSSADNSRIEAPDMTRPLTEYYISSSHNTYLVGEQWRGESTVEGYIRVLLADCRCVESELPLSYKWAQSDNQSTYTTEMLNR